MDLNIRAVEQEFVDRLKADAVKNGRTLRGHVLYVLGQSLGEIENLTAIPPKVDSGSLAQALTKTRLGIPRRSPAHPAPISQKSNVGHGINCRCFECKPVKVRNLE